MPRGASCTLQGTIVGGNVFVKRGAVLRAIGARIEGNVQAKRARNVIVRAVDGDVQAFSNRGGVVIRGNRIDGNLQCRSNRPAPVGGNNRMSGNKEGQCRRL
ncbi:MAG TPA: hypothetical protein VF097_09775 [Actinomycetota bacterium]